MKQPEKLLTIGGWDPCGSYGAVADLKTFAALNCHGMGAMTVVTAQNSKGWYGAEFMSAEFVAQQLDAILDDYGARSVKTGFIGKVDLIEVIAEKLVEYEVKNIVVDPVLVNNHGRAMFPPEVVDAYHKHLFPLATVVTPNRREFNLILSGETAPWEMNQNNVSRAITFVDSLSSQGSAPAFAIKGLPFEDNKVADSLIQDGKIELFPHDQIDTINISGTGDSFSAALSCQLALGLSLSEAVQVASELTLQAIEMGADWQLATHSGPIGHIAFRNG
ncbi:MAG: hydroxymethylpyrimidine/phosphomethylpyrimidine kinase [Anaerolineae bacterium]